MTNNAKIDHAEQAIIDDILTYWFGHKNLLLPATPEAKKRWFSGTEAIDNEIRSQFGDHVESALNGKLSHWAESPDGRLALILLLDQFTRNVYRKQAKAFEGDALALSLAKSALENDNVKQLGIQQQVFVITPLEHSESLEDQQRCVDFMNALILKTDDEHPLMGYLQDTMRYVKQHHHIIEQFGRFPHRNAVLGRDSTPEETTYLDGKSTSFGQ